MTGTVRLHIAVAAIKIAGTGTVPDHHRPDTRGSSVLHGVSTVNIAKSVTLVIITKKKFCNAYHELSPNKIDKEAVEKPVFHSLIFYSPYISLAFFVV